MIGAEKIKGSTTGTPVKAHKWRSRADLPILTMNPRSVRTALHMGDGCRFISFGSHCTFFSASTESTVTSGKIVPLKDAFPEFAETELSRAISIPLDDPLPKTLTEILEMIAEHFAMIDRPRVESIHTALAAVVRPSLADAPLSQKALEPYVRSRTPLTQSAPLTDVDRRN